uniref:Acetyl-CoA carboxylase n=1 Tax=Chrysotila carterae TaxID=13221 RepID=A0A7S4BXK4_CHRCT
MSSEFEAFCAQAGATKPIRRILIANNGMAARKFILSVRNWCYQSFGDATIIKLLAMATPEDIKANAMHINSADAFFEVPGGPNFNNYANVNVITRLAVAHKADAVWPGWGHASENPALPRTLDELGIVFIGPTDRSMFLLGDKIASTIIAQSAQVPCVEWSGSGLAVQTDETGQVAVPDAVFDAACVSSAEEAVTVAAKVGYPVMIKASEGGGGKGVRMANNAEQVGPMYRQVVDEVKGSPVFLMRLCTGARHIEVQILADKHKNVAILSGRDCSMQRRFQKIVEEGPPRAVAPETLHEMEQAAARLALTVGYTHAGTVEYLFIQETQQFYFLELNPRLQVEHPVTEGITGTNLPALQLMVAMGINLTALPEEHSISKYLVDPFDASAPYVDPFSKVSGHCVAVRLTAENASDGWKPTVGNVTETSFQSSPQAWGYFSIRPPAEVHSFADSQFGHVFAVGKTRTAAVRAAIRAVSQVRIVGEIHTNITYVSELLGMQDFLENRVTTSWLDKLISEQMQLKPPSIESIAICGALLKGHLTIQELRAKLHKDYLWRNACPPPEAIGALVETKVDFIWNQISFSFEVFRHSPEIFTISANGTLAQAKLKVSPGGSFICSFGDNTCQFRYEKEPGDKIRMMLDGFVVMLEREKDPSKLEAPYGGKLVQYLVSDGAHVNKGDAYAEMEVMKMLFALPAPEAGVVSLLKPAGSFVNAGEALGRLALDDPSLVAKAKPFDGDLGNFEAPPEMIEPIPTTPLHEQYKYLVARTHNMLDGFVDNEDEVLQRLSALLLNPKVMSAEFDELIAGPGSKLPQAPRAALEQLHAQGNVHKHDCFGSLVLDALRAHEATLPDAAAVAAFRAAAEPVYSFGHKYESGMLDFSTSCIASFIEHFLLVERVYPDDRAELLGVYHLNEAHKDDVDTVLSRVLSHNQLERKVALILNALDFLGTFTHMNAAVFSLLQELSSLESVKHARVHRKAKQITASFNDNIAKHSKEEVMPYLRTLADASLSVGEELSLVTSISEKLNSCQPKLLSMLAHSDKALRRAVIKAAVLTWYGTSCAVKNLSVKTYLRKGKEKASVTWEYLAQSMDSSRSEPRFGVMLVFASMDDLEANFDDLCQLALAERPTNNDADTTAAATTATDAAPAPSPPPISISSSSSRSLGRPSTKNTPAALHVLVLGENSTLRDSGSKFGGQRAFRRSFAYAVMDESTTGKSYHKILNSKAAYLRSNDVAQVSVLLPTSTDASLGDDNLNYVSVFNFEAHHHFEENKLMRHILPPQATALELHRLSNFEVERCWFPDAPQVHVYLAVAKKQPLDTRFFVRLLAHSQEGRTVSGATQLLQPTSQLLQGFATLEQAIGDSRYKPTESNHIFVRYLAPLRITLQQAVKTLKATLTSCMPTINKLQATELELAIPLWDPSVPDADLDSTKPTQVRIICRLAPSLSIDAYEEVSSFVSSGTYPAAATTSPASVAAAAAIATTHTATITLKPILGKGATATAIAPYTLLSVVDQKRLRCKKLRTTYAYDFVTMYELAVQAAWDRAVLSNPKIVAPADEKKVHATELVLSADGSRVEPLSSPRSPGANDCGMLAWRLHMLTPEYPQGREIILIANDITFMNGSFGVKEDMVYERASQLARAEGLPRIYMAANSGARFGLCDGVKKCFRVQWNDYDPAKGVAYLWLTDKDREALGESVLTEPVAAPIDPSFDDDEDEREEEEPAVHHKITTIIGAPKEEIGVESLQAAGRIAAETSIANRQIFTLGYCTARNIGIGSYVLRLGQRVVQQQDAPIILTGYVALNKLLGTNVYESNLQLGGPEVMAGNGVSHLVVDDDFGGVVRIVEWLGFVPKVVTGAPRPILPVCDPVERPVCFTPLPGKPYDPRMLLTGGEQSGAFKEGLLDANSFVEYLPHWAKTVVVGRGRLGGMPVGVIITENRTVEKSILADPANLESKPQTAMQAGQVWFPDSAYKTAQAIRDFNTGEGLPLLLLANWRGFSGGRKDMFEEILKFGSFIVDELTQYKQPIIVYIPPHCEIRGGAWVVIDATINPRYMEMYAAPSARGGVLEPAGIAEIKFRRPDVVKSMARLDKQLQWMSMNEASGVVRNEDIEARKEELLQYYTPLGELISDLHDRPERMVAKGVVKRVVEWESAREFFYWRLRRRLLEDDLVSARMQGDSSLGYEETLTQLHSTLPAESLLDDKLCFQMLEEDSEANL